MKAAIFKNQNTIEVTQIASPILQDKGAIIRVNGCGLCGSDLVKLKQSLVKPGAVLGHEVVGTITQINSSNKKFNIGDKVALGHHVPCFKCTYCRGENYSMCKKFKQTNIVPGGFSEYIFASEDHLNNTVAKIPDSISFEQASLMEPVACCLRAIKRARVQTEDSVLIIGLGSIGLLMGQLAKHYGAKVYGCDLQDDRLELAKELGFDKVLKFENNETSSQKLRELTGSIGADRVFLTAGSNNSVSFATSTVRDGGTILVFASVSNDNIGFNNNEIYYRELTVLGSYSPSCDDLHESLNLIEQGIIKTDKLVQNFNIDNINDAITDTLEGKTLKAFIKVQQD